MSMVKLKNKTSRNGFDLSRKNAFTAKVGELLPVACIECLPGDSFNLEHQHFTRTRPVNTAAYTRIREYYDWFFVPTNLLWNKFNTVITQMIDNKQHADGIIDNAVLTNQLPYFTTAMLQSYVQNANGKTNAYGYDRGSLSAKLLSYLGYGDFSYKTSDNYGNGDSYITNLSLNPFPLLAYQKIYSDWYRNSQWESSYAPAWNIDYIRGTSGSTFEIPTAQLVGLLGQGHSTENMFDLRYRNWNKDLFMGVLPSAQYGAAASIITPSFGSGYNASNSLYTSGSSTSDSSLVNPSGTNRLETSDGRGTYIYFSPQTLQSLSERFGISDASILSLRYAEAEQKWKEITQSTQQDYKSQLEAHWDVHVSDAYSERCKFIDGSVSNLDISEVVNTNITADNEASVAGKGVGVGQGKCKFSTDIHGYLMCIYSAVPLLDYATTGVKRMCTRTAATDFAIPEFDAIGMEPLGLEQLINTKLSSRVPSSTELITNLGYVPRYIDYKTAIDEVHGAFAKVSDGLNDWVAPLTNDYFMNYLIDLVDTGIGASNSVTYQFFKVNPNILDPIFDVNADSSVSTDQLWVNAAFDIKAVRKLDRNGLPY